MPHQVTIGIDVGSTSVKAVAVDATGAVLARSKVRHPLLVPAPDRFEHDAGRAWRKAPRQALAKLGEAGREAMAVAVTSVVPSMTAVDSRGYPLTPGLLYGDARGGHRPGDARSVSEDVPGFESSGEIVGFLSWTASRAPDAAGYWPAQAVANRAIGGRPVVDFAVALGSIPLYGHLGWDASICAACGVDPSQLPVVEETGSAIGRIGSDGPVLSAGTVDVLCEQLVAGAGEPGDVHVVCGTSLVIWAVTSEPVSTPGLWTLSRGDDYLVGGVSNAGGLFLDWARRISGRPFERFSSAHALTEEPLDPENIPVWLPYPRGERNPYHDPARRGALLGLNLTHGPAAVERAAWEASGFVVRHYLELAGVKGKRLVATGGGTQLSGWMQAMADTMGLPVHAAADPEGAARGAAFVARIAAGLDHDLDGAARWARTGRIVEPDPRWSGAADARFQIFLEGSGSPS